MLDQGQDPLLLQGLAPEGADNSLLADPGTPAPAPIVPPVEAAPPPMPVEQPPADMMSQPFNPADFAPPAAPAPDPAMQSTSVGGSVSQSSSGVDMGMVGKLDAFVNKGFDFKAGDNLQKQSGADYVGSVKTYEDAAQREEMNVGLLEADYNDIAAEIESEKALALEDERQAQANIARDTKLEADRLKTEWETHKRELDAAIAVNPTDVFGGWAGAGMIMTKAAGAYLTAMGVDNSLSQDMDQWVNHVATRQKSLVEGRTAQMGQIDKMMSTVWQNAVNEQDARAKVTQLGLSALNSQLEAEKYKTTSKVRLAKIEAAQAKIGMEAAAAVDASVKQTVAAGAQLAVQRAQAASAYASARASNAQRVATIASQALAERKAAREEAEQYAGRVVKVIKSDNTEEARAWRTDSIGNGPQAGRLVEMGADLKAFRDSARDMNAMLSDKNMREKMTVGGMGFGAVPPEMMQLATKMVLAKAKIDFGSLTETEAANAIARAGLNTPGGISKAAMGLISEWGGGGNPAQKFEAWVDVNLKDSQRRYDSFANNLTRPMEEWERQSTAPAIAADRARQDEKSANESGLSKVETTREELAKAVGAAFSGDARGVSKILNVGLDAATDSQRRVAQATQTEGFQENFGVYVQANQAIGKVEGEYRAKLISDAEYTNQLNNLMAIRQDALQKSRNTGALVDAAYGVAANKKLIVESFSALNDVVAAPVSARIGGRSGAAMQVDGATTDQRWDITNQYMAAGGDNPNGRAAQTLQPMLARQIEKKAIDPMIERFLLDIAEGTPQSVAAGRTVQRY